MGTRGAYGFYKDGVDKLTYNHFDSYYNGLGENIVSFIRATPIEEMHTIYDRIVMVDRSGTATPAQIKECKEHYDDSVDGGKIENWYALLRNSQGDLRAYKNGLKYMIDSYAFMFDAVFNEYSYIINLDDNVLEVWRGFGKDEEEARKTRYYKPNNDSLLQGLQSYWMRLIATFPLDSIPENWDELCLEHEEHKDE